ncbi:unnamed protein product [Rhizophagus irregularis]|uniref:Uncharacterized protein n=1 Tax=Rhizophagus irregularis TaxID=588596 RepID=A0A916EKP1_9GLOM|nr:unnamed protein product [Rhizophagus irregularis]
MRTFLVTISCVSIVPSSDTTNLGKHQNLMVIIGISHVFILFIMDSSAVSLEVAASPLFEGTGPLLVVAVAVAVSSLVFVLVPISGS